MPTKTVCIDDGFVGSHEAEIRHLLDKIAEMEEEMSKLRWKLCDAQEEIDKLVVDPW